MAQFALQSVMFGDAGVVATGTLAHGISDMVKVGTYAAIGWIPWDSACREGRQCPEMDTRRPEAGPS